MLLQDDLVEYHNQHKRFPLPEVNLPKRIWADVIVTMWVCLCSIPVFLMTLYLAWIGYWIMLVLIIGALVGGEMTGMISDVGDV